MQRKNLRLVEILLARERTLLSRQRTYFSQAGFSLGLATLGFGMIRFFDGPEYSTGDVITRMGWLLVFCGFLLIIYSFAGYKQNLRHLYNLKKKIYPG